MTRPSRRRAAIAVLALFLLIPANGQAASNNTIGNIVAQAIKPVMAQYGVPGMAVGVIINGQAYVYNYGVASQKTGRPITADTLFEIGSVSKTFTATLAAYAQRRGDLLLSDMASQYLPPLRGSAFDHVSLVNLGTHTPGGMPLQTPDSVATPQQLIAYFRAWKPAYPPGTYRTYSNISITLLGMITADSMHETFPTLMQSTVFSGLGLQHTYLDIPKTQMANYVQGYTKTGAPIRMAPSVLSPEAYGIRTTAADLLRFVAANMGVLALDPTLQNAITDTHTGYYRIQTGGLTQDLIWEEYHYPVRLDDLLAGNSDAVASKPNPVSAITPPLPPQDNVLIDKTGSTNGFASYVAFVPGQKIGIVILANKNYPSAARVTAAYNMLTHLAPLEFSSGRKARR